MKIACWNQIDGVVREAVMALSPIGDGEIA